MYKGVCQHSQVFNQKRRDKQTHVKKFSATCITTCYKMILQEFLMTKHRKEHFCYERLGNICKKIMFGSFFANFFLKKSLWLVKQQAPP